MFGAVDEEGALVQLYFLGKHHQEEITDRLEAAGHSITWKARALSEVHRQIDEYFARKRKKFEIPLRLMGTAFQTLVWNELLQIPYGQTLSYGELAARIGRPGASRAVGRANATNPVSLIVPCHRVIGADRDLTGYGGGIDIKKRLLILEGAFSESEQLSLGSWTDR
ncbi:MAG: methylated-DNA--[protein]-cysteine S-methyltransferase [Acidobacteriia bacterium]|nr:methylated-DNA--[protein]-cysteine S-methyltransferase [Terriglobia bacterium]